MAANGQTARKLIERLQSLRVLEFIKAPPESRGAIRQTIRELCDVFSSVDLAERIRIVAQVRDTFSFVFFWFARVMAEEAVRESSDEAIRYGILALLVENYVFDGRETQIRLALLYNSAAKLALNPEIVFANAASLAVSPEVAVVVREFPLRPLSSRRLGAFLYEESGSGNSFAYRKLGDEEELFR